MKSSLLTPDDEEIQKKIADRIADKNELGIKNRITVPHKKCGGTFRRMYFQKAKDNYAWVQIKLPYFCCDKCLEIVRIKIETKTIIITKKMGLK